MILKRPSFRFSWYHRDELQIVVLAALLVLFFSRSAILSTFTLALIVLSVVFLYVFRWVRRIFLENSRIRFAAAWIRRVESRLVFTSPERSRIAMTILCCLVLGILCIHRITLTLTLPRFETPTDIYWILLLGWYWAVCSFVFGYLWYRAVKGSKSNDGRQSSFLQGLVASVFFYHGLPAKQRILTFATGFVLGGLPTYLATRLASYNPREYAYAAVLILPVVVLTLGGAWYATRWNPGNLAGDPPWDGS